MNCGNKAYWIRKDNKQLAVYSRVYRRFSYVHPKQQFSIRKRKWEHQRRHLYILRMSLNKTFVILRYSVDVEYKNKCYEYYYSSVGNHIKEYGNIPQDISDMIYDITSYWCDYDISKNASYDDIYIYHMNNHSYIRRYSQYVYLIEKIQLLYLSYKAYVIHF